MDPHEFNTAPNYNSPRRYAYPTPRANSRAG
jgi:hypothetical protein